MLKWVIINSYFNILLSEHFLKQIQMTDNVAHIEQCFGLIFLMPIFISDSVLFYQTRF